MKVKAIVPYFGGKRTLAPTIVDLLGKHTQYFEPFCGSMAVLFAKKPSQKETVNDLNGDLINLARVLQDLDSAEILYNRLQSVLFCEEILKDANENLQNESNKLMEYGGTIYQQHINRAYWYFISSWMMRNGVAGTQRMEYQIAVRWTKGGGSPTVRFRNVVESIPPWHQRFQNVVILQRNAFQILDRFEDCEATAIYCDPPYYSESRSGFGKRGVGSKYIHEFEHGESPKKKKAGGLFDEEKKVDQHELLRDILSGYKKARIVISYYDCPKVRDLYSGSRWKFHEHTRHKHLNAAAGRGNRPKEAPEEAPEVLITNF